MHNSMQTMMHLHISKNHLEGATTAIIPGDPARVEKIAREFNKPRFLAQNREFTSWLCEANNGKKIVVCSTGIGGPSTAIAIEELAMCGVKDFIRAGTTGAIQPHMEPGSVVIMTGAVRLEGTSRNIAPIEFPAVAHHDWVRVLIESAKELQIKHEVGISATCDTFYQGQNRRDTYQNGFFLRELEGRIKELEQLGVLSLEMEASLVLTQTAAYGLRGGCIAGVLVNRHLTERITEDSVKKTEQNVINLLKVAVNKFLT